MCNSKKTGTGNQSSTKATYKKFGEDVPLWRWWIGLFQASVFSLVYFLTPTYFLLAMACLIFQFPSSSGSFWFAAPIAFSMLFTKAYPASPAFFRLLEPMLDYFQYEEIFEISDDSLIEASRKGKRYLVASQPHGVISFCSICAKISASPEAQQIPTAVASALLKTPILKNVMGVFRLMDASAKSVRRHLQKTPPGPSASIVIYVGGIAELFKSSRKEERLYLKARKGFIKIALQDENVDIIPIYLFGNTSVLTVVKTGILARLSRKAQVSLTYFWGKWGLPLPRDVKCLYVRGKPMGLPHIPEPTDADIDEWHAKYCDAVVRLFDTYKEKHPEYKHKTLFID